MAHRHRNHSRQPDPNATQAMPEPPKPAEAADWPTMPDPVSPSSSGAIPHEPTTGPLPMQSRGGDGNRPPREDWRQTRAERERAWREPRAEQQRREYLWRRQFEVRLERQRLAAEEQALQQQWDALPRPAS